MPEMVGHGVQLAHQVCTTPSHPNQRTFRHTFPTNPNLFHLTPTPHSHLRLAISTNVRFIRIINRRYLLCECLCPPV
jgi:hypothetical protein